MSYFRPYPCRGRRALSRSIRCRPTALQRRAERQSRDGAYDGSASSLDDFVAAIGYVTNLIGEDPTGIGSDLTRGYGKRPFDWLTLDAGHGCRLMDLGAVVSAEGLRIISEFLNVTTAMQRARWTESRIRKIIGENWPALLGTVCD